MFDPTREEARRFLFETWRKYRDREILSELEALAAEPGPILSAVIELNRRWQALDMDRDAARLAELLDPATYLGHAADLVDGCLRGRAGQGACAGGTRATRTLRSWCCSMRSARPPQSGTHRPARSPG